VRDGMNPRKLLFICSQNRARSLTAEKIFNKLPGYQARSAGTQRGARVVVTEGHAGWAELIFVMEKSHLYKLRQKCGDALDGKHVITLHIPDDYDFMQPELVDELMDKVRSYLELPDEPPPNQSPPRS
jgi:predicted protein tyrosine phosphatase